METDPENTLGDVLQIEALLTSRLKSLEFELSEARRDLLGAKQREVSGCFSAYTIVYTTNPMSIDV